MNSLNSTVNTVFTKRKDDGEERKKSILPGIMAAEKVGKDNDQRVKPEKTDITCF